VRHPVLAATGQPVPTRVEDPGIRGPILLVESDPDAGSSLAEQLTADGYRVARACTARHARALAQAGAPCLALLGELDPPRGALRLLQQIRASDPTWAGCAAPTLPAIVIGSRRSQLELLRAFEAGADDFLARPADYLELRVRIGALLRRSESRAAHCNPIEVGALMIDVGARAVSVGGRAIALRRLEFELLAHLARDPERVFSKAELLSAVWGFRSSASTRTVESHASRLRRRLEAGGEHPWVVNVRGVGYRLI